MTAKFKAAEFDETSIRNNLCAEYMHQFKGTYIDIDKHKKLYNEIVSGFLHGFDRGFEAQHSRDKATIEKLLGLIEKADRLIDPDDVWHTDREEWTKMKLEAGL